MKRAMIVFPLIALILLVLQDNHLLAQSEKRHFYELKIYHYSGTDNEARLDQYLKDALVPGLHRAGIKRVGVFKSGPADTSAVRKIYVLTTFASLNEMEGIAGILEKDKKYLAAANEYINAAYNHSPYTRIEKIILKAFIRAPDVQQSALTGNRMDRVYELRSYEGATEKLYNTKVKMFNDGDEVGIFKRLGFNAIFYGEVIAGKSMPNLMYLTSFENMHSRDNHWKAFSDDAQWLKLKADKQYENTVSHSDIYLLYPAPYSDL